MKHLIVIVSLMVFSASARAQTTTASNPVPSCQLAINRSPVVRGIKLGMKVDEVLRLFPGADQDEQVKSALSQRTAYPQLGVFTFYVFPGHYPTKAQYAGISMFNFVSIDDRIAAYEVNYANPPEGPSWRRVEDWVAKFAESYELPAISNWTGEQNRSDRTLRCDGFQVSASNLNQRGNVTVSSLEQPWKEQQRRREAFDEKLRREFKP